MAGTEMQALEAILPDKFKVGDQEVDKETFLQNIAEAGTAAEMLALLQAENTQQKGTIDQLRTQVGQADGRITELSASVQALQTAKPGEDTTAERDFAAERLALDEDDPNYQRDYDNLWRDEMAERDRKHTADLEGVKTEVTSRVNATLAQDRLQQSAADHNNDILAKVLGDKDRVPVDLNPEEHNAVRAELNKIWDPSYGHYDKDAQRYFYNEQAVEAALQMVPSVRQKIRDHFTEQAAEESRINTEKALGDAATRGLPGGAGGGVPPSEGAGLEEKVAYFNRLSEQGKVDFIRANPDLYDQLIKAEESGEIDLNDRKFRHPRRPVLAA